MLKNYIKIAWRNLSKSKTSSIINIGGLAVGMTVALLIGLWIYDEVSFDRYHTNYDRIGQVLVHNGQGSDEGTYTYLPLPVAQELRTLYSNDFTYVVAATGKDDHIIVAGDKKLTEAGDFMEPAGPVMLSLHVVAGSRSSLEGTHSILLAASLAKKLFGTTNPINQVIKLDNTSIANVTGVYEDLPVNSTFSGIHFIAPWDMLLASSDFVRGDVNNWNDNSFFIFVQLSPYTNFEKVSTTIRNAELPHIDKGRAASDPALFVHPMRKWHLFSTFENRMIVTSEALKFVWFYGCIGIFVLALACINFMNLSTARSEQRVKEVGIRKTMGSARSQLIVQFFCESVLTSLLAFLVCMLVVQLMFPWFNGVAAKTLAIPWGNPWFWTASIGFTLFTGLFAGSYPAFYLSSFRPVKVLKGAFRAGRLASLPRKVLVVFQFTVSIALVIGTLVVFHQIQYAKDRPVGYTRAGLIQVRMTSPDFQGKYGVLTDELGRTGVVAHVAESSSPVTGSWSNTGGIEWPGKDPSQESDFAMIRVTPEYGKTVGFDLLEGRDFSRTFATDSSGFIINEAAAKYMGLTDATGKMVHWNNPYDKVNKDFKILGVVKDMVMNSPFEKVKQTIFRIGGDPGWISIRINPGVSAGNALPKIAAIFKKLIPAAPFDYSFVDEEYATKFAAEERVQSLAAFFAFLAIFISCLGLFGLAAFMAEQRTKEIGVRKVLGASVLNIWQMLSLDFIKLVVVSCMASIPIAYVFMSRWLQQYEYRSSISWWLLAFVGAGALVLTLLTVSYQAVKTALRNPVRSLRAE